MPAYGSEEMYRYAQQPRAQYSPQYSGVNTHLELGERALQRKRQDTAALAQDYSDHQRWIGDKVAEMPEKAIGAYRDSRKFATEEEQAKWNQKFAEQKHRGNEYDLGTAQDAMEQRQQQRAFESGIDEKTGKTRAESARELQYRTPFTEEQRGNESHERQKKVWGQQDELFPLTKQNLQSGIDLNRSQVANAAFDRKRGLAADAAQEFAMAGTDQDAIDNVRLTYGKHLSPAEMAKAENFGAKIAAKNAKDSAATEIVASPNARGYVARNEELGTRMQAIEELSGLYNTYLQNRSPSGVTTPEGEEAVRQIVNVLDGMGEKGAAQAVQEGWSISVSNWWNDKGLVKDQQQKIANALKDVAQRTQLQLGAMNQTYGGLNNQIINQGIQGGQATLTNFNQNVGSLEDQWSKGQLGKPAAREMTPDELTKKVTRYPGMELTHRKIMIEEPKPAKSVTATKAPR